MLRFLSRIRVSQRQPDSETRRSPSLPRRGWPISGFARDQSRDKSHHPRPIPPTPLPTLRNNWFFSLPPAPINISPKAAVFASLSSAYRSIGEGLKPGTDSKSPHPQSDVNKRFYRAPPSTVRQNRHRPPHVLPEPFWNRTGDLFSNSGAPRRLTNLAALAFGVMESSLIAAHHCNWCQHRISFHSILDKRVA